MKVLTLGLGAFGFAINMVLGKNHPGEIFYAYEKNTEVTQTLLQSRQHPFFFAGYTLPENIEVLEEYTSNISDVDVLILAIPAQFISQALAHIKDALKPWVIILNLAKGIDLDTNTPMSAVVASQLQGKIYHYSVLSGGMIAEEVVQRKKVWADIGIEDWETWKLLQQLFQNDVFDISIRHDVVNIELYGSLKNIMAILVGYYEGKGYEKSTIGFHLVKFYDEMRKIVEVYGGSKNIDFWYYSLWGDMIATCFWNSRNRYFGHLLWEGKSGEEARTQLQKENKHAEGYETLKAVYNKVGEMKWFENIKFLYNVLGVK